MAEQIEDYSGDRRFSGVVKKVKGLEKINKIKDPNHEILEKDMSRMEIIKYHSEITAQCIGYMAQCIKEKSNDAGQKQVLDELAKKNYFVTRLVQKWADDQEEKASGSYFGFDPNRKTIIKIPEEIATGTVETISDSGLKLLETFQGTTKNEAEKLQTFLDSLFDIAQTNNLTEKAVIKVLRRKLEGNARKLLNMILDEFVSKSKEPTLKEIILRLEDRYCSEFQPQVASAKLSMYTKGKNQPYQFLEGDIHELCKLAVRGEDVTNEKEWITNKKTAVFKQAITEADRKLINTENQTRIMNNLPELTISQMADLLIKTESEADAYATASNLKYQPRLGDSEYIQKVKDKKEDEDEDEEDDYDEDEDEEDDEDEEGDYEENDIFEGKTEEQIKTELFAMYKSKKNQQCQRNKAGNHNNTYQDGNYQNGHNGNFDRPRNFVTAEMVNTDVGACFKCNGQNHKFTEKEKCIYGEYKLFQKPCFTCGVGGHHFTNCIKNRQPNGESPRQNRQELDDPYKEPFPRQAYQDFTKSIQDKPEWEWERPLSRRRNDAMPPLFPW